jgi:uncharacterized protein YwqG
MRPLINVEYDEIVDDPKPWSSHIYGPSDLPAGMSAPVDEAGQALCMVAQINLAELPDLPTVQGNPSTIARLPKAGVLQFWLALSNTGAAGWSGGPTLAETADNPKQQVTYISQADVQQAPAVRQPVADRCSSNPPAQGPVVTIGMKFSIGWNVPETTDARFDLDLPTLAGSLRANPPDEFYRATNAINALLGATPSAQIGGFNRLVNSDPRTIGVDSEDESRVAPITDSFEVLFEMQSTDDSDEKWAIGFGNAGAGGWWANPKDIMKLADPDGPTAGRSGKVRSAFWWDAQVSPAS